MEAIRRPPLRSSMLAIFFVVITLGALVCTRFIDSSAALMIQDSTRDSISTAKTANIYTSKAPGEHQKVSKPINIPLNCSLGIQSTICPANYYPSTIPDEAKSRQSTPPPSCPDYFRWIYEDLWPWRETGITRDMVRNARRTANFRLVILNGKAYVRVYAKAFQSRDTFTLWGILQLLRRYPGQLPDLDLMFDCVDWPVIKKNDFKGPNKAPPPLFRYCGNDSTHDIVFPDWSFWGWPEINIKPWNELAKDLEEGNTRSKWTDREPHAFWKGNPYVAETRMDLLKCNVSDKYDWNARIYAQDWLKEQKEGYKSSDLASQCTNRYKIYIEGSAWSVSEKYILACNSLALVVKPIYYDFFTRGLIPLKHYWPIKEDDKCRSIKHAVDWGNSHQEEAQDIGNAASRFVLDDLRMDFVYDYMFHLLSEYAKLLQYKPSIPNKAVEICSELACRSKGLTKKFMMDSLVKGPATTGPCTMPPPYDPARLHSVIEGKNSRTKQVEAWEREYWRRT